MFIDTSFSAPSDQRTSTKYISFNKMTTTGANNIFPSINKQKANHCAFVVQKLKTTVSERQKLSGQLPPSNLRPFLIRQYHRWFFHVCSMLLHPS